MKGLSASSTADESRQNAHETPAKRAETAPTRAGGRPCATCALAPGRRALLEERIRAGEPMAQISRAFQIGVDALARHRDRHMSAAEEVSHVPAAGAPTPAPGPAGAVQLANPAELVRAGDPIAEADDLRIRTYSLLGKAMSRLDYPLALRCVSELRAQVEQSAKLKGQLQEASAAVVVVDVQDLQRKLEDRLARLAPPAKIIDVEG